MRRRVVITGLGCISPLGNGVESTWENLIAGKSGVDYITHFDTSDLRTKFAAEIKGFDGKALFGHRGARRMDRFTQYALAAAMQAVESANIYITDSNRDRIGVVVGSGIGGIETLFNQTLVYLEKGANRVSPLMIPMMITDTGPAAVAIHFGVRGPNLSVVTACATGTNAIGEATEIIRRGDADVMLAGGSEAAIMGVSVAGLNVMGAISRRNDDPQAASRPFELNRDGFVMGEGAAVVVLEAVESAQKRDAAILAEIIGYAATNDAFHITAPAIEGAGAALCMKNALNNAGLSLEDIDYVNAHGTSTILNDMSETAAIKATFGDLAYDIPISSIKSMTGHLMGASGALEVVTCVKILQEGILPPTINYETPDPECDLDYVPNTARVQDVNIVMSNSFGFGGHNATIILTKYADIEAENHQITGGSQQGAEVDA
ncbi:MAG: beta-ketoacyl-ACP synthase II [Chloroflexota bacterium]|nr:beta-ketoacyl-ACP synthase II [Chloroflexota bacterium]